MIQIGTKDKIFAAVVLPILIIGGFIYAVRSPAVKMRNDMKAQIAQLPDPVMFPTIERRLKENIEAAEVELKKVKDEKPPALKVVSDKNSSIAGRREEVLSLFKENGVSVRTILPEDNKGFVGDVLKGTGMCPSPSTVKISLEGEYQKMVKSLTEIEKRKMAVIVESLQLVAGGKCKWEIVLWF
jgi:hypothetical protein